MKIPHFLMLKREKPLVWFYSFFKFAHINKNSLTLTLVIFMNNMVYVKIKAPYS